MPQIDAKYSPRLRRWSILLAVSILLHLLAFNWATDNLSMPTLRHNNNLIITTTMQSAAPQTQAPIAEKINPEKKQKHTQQPSATTPPVASHQISHEQESVIDTNAGVEAPGTSVETAVAPQDEKLNSNSSSNASPALEEINIASPTGVTYKVTPPPSVVLTYDVKKIQRDGQHMYGHGSISWQSSGGTYTINGEAGVLFITALTFKSEGVLDDYGISPVIYTEKRIRKSATNTHFHRERNIISFSSSEVSYPRKGGEQDRASIIWQLAGIGRGDSEKIFPNATIDIFVAGVRDGEVWRMHVIGEEDLELGAGKLRAWHVQRTPKPGSYEPKLDIWLSPQREWYPVRLLYTDANGDYLDMSLSDMRMALPQ